MFADVFCDGRPAYSRFFVLSLHDALSFYLATATRFDYNQYGFNSIKGIDQGWPLLPRMLADVNGDGRADYCRFVGAPPNIRLSCNLATATAFDDNQAFNSIEDIDQDCPSL